MTFDLDITEENTWDEYKQGILTWNDLFNSFTGKPTEKGKIVNRAKWKLMMRYRAYKFKEIQDSETGEKKQITCGIKPTRLSKLIQNEFGFNFLTLKDTKEVGYFNGKYYRFSGEAIIHQTAEDFMMDFSTIHYKNEIASDIRDFHYVDRDIFKTEPKYINLENGVLDITTGELHNHSSEYLFLNILPVEYDPATGCKHFERFLQHISMQQKKRRPVIEKTIQEYMGYSLIRNYFYKKYVVLDGRGDNAKTTLLDVMLALIGSHNNTSVSLQELNTRPFAKSQLYGKLTNISDDLPKKGLKYTGVIKQITGNSPMWADIKNHKKGIFFTNIAKPWYACNELPETEDVTDAFFSRQLQITLLNQYLPKGSKNIDDYTIFEADPELIKILTTPQELTGILNFAIKGYKRLKKQGHFSLDKDITTELKRETWLKKTNPIHSFLEDEIERTEPDWVITVDDFFELICDYCDRYGFDRPTRHKVTSKMHNENIKKQQKTIDGESRVWCWIGLRHTIDTAKNHYIGERKDGVIC
jgi:putative DNA primase/helicase